MTTQREELEGQGLELTGEALLEWITMRGQARQEKLQKEKEKFSAQEFEFLKSEYGTSIDLIKYYDGRHVDLLKFASGLSAGVSTVVFGFYGLSETAAKYVWDFATFIAATTALALVAVFAAMVRNRVYFVFPARQANMIRSVLFPEGKPDGGGEKQARAANQMYSTREVPMFDFLSTQSLQLLFVALQAAFFGGVAVYAYRRSGITLDSITSGLFAGAVVLVGLIGGASKYLHRRRGQKANDVFDLAKTVKA